MRAVALDYERRRLIERDIPEPSIERADQVLFRVEEVGVCGTDRELAAFQNGYPPPGESYLVLGHEARGRVIGTGAAVTSLRAGDCVVPMIRRACSPPCSCCARRRSDLCVTGKYSERGIHGLHGYFCEMAVDAEQDLIAVPEACAEFAVVAEPLSVVEKAIATALRLREEPPVTAGVLGAGPVGLLAAMALRARGLDVWLHSLEPPDHPRARLTERMGARYTQSLDWKADLVVEATGSAEASFAALRCLRPLGVCALLGAAQGTGTVSFRDLVVGNRIVFGSVNSSPEAFALAIADLGRFDPALLASLIERRPFSAFAETIPAPASEAVKIAHVIAGCEHRLKSVPPVVSNLPVVLAPALACESLFPQPARLRSWMPYQFRHAICNEAFDKWPFADACKAIRKAGYSGIEIAPFTLAEDPVALSAQSRRECRAAIAAEGLLFVGLHWLMVSPKGLHVTTPDAALREKSWRHIRGLIDLCADLGPGGIMVFGSPVQRGSTGGSTPAEATRRYVDGLASVAPHALERGVTVLVEALPRAQCDVVLTLAEAAGIVREIGSPAIRTMFDTHNAVDEVEPHAALVEEYYDLIRHVHVNEMDGGYCGTGSYDFRPVLDVLRRRGYPGWVSLEAFDFEPGAETIANESLRYLEARIAELPL